MTRRSLAEVITVAIDTKLVDVHTALIGKVVSFDNSGVTVDVELLQKRALDAEDGSTTVEVLPKLLGVPVATIQGGGFSLTFPLSVGDKVLVIVSEVDITPVMTTNQPSAPDDLRRFDLSHAIALPLALTTDKETLPEAAEPAMCLVGADIRIGDYQSANVEALVKKNEFQNWKNDVNSAIGDLKTALTTITAPSGGGPCTVTDNSSVPSSVPEYTENVKAK